MTGSSVLEKKSAAEILVFIDLAGGEIDDAGKGILSEGSRLAKKLDCAFSAIAFGSVGSAPHQDLAPYGVPELCLIESGPEVADSLEAQGHLLAAAASDLGARVVLLPHNDLGESLAPLIAARMEGALFTEAISYDDRGGSLQVMRQVLGARVAESKLWDGSVPLVLTMNLRVLSAVVLPTMQRRDPQVTAWRGPESVSTEASRILERIPADPQTVDVTEAEVMVSAGLGCNETSFQQVKELARLLNASLGVTRPVYDLGFAEFERMVGQTGKTVAPRFYLALGISGSMHHLGGIKDSKKIVSLNNDPKVPLFPNSDEGFVADLREVLPLLIERVKTATGGAS